MAGEFLSVCRVVLTWDPISENTYRLNGNKVRVGVRVRLRVPVTIRIDASDEFSIKPRR